MLKNLDCFIPCYEVSINCADCPEEDKKAAIKWLESNSDLIYVGGKHSLKWGKKAVILPCNLPLESEDTPSMCHKMDAIRVPRLIMQVVNSARNFSPSIRNDIFVQFVWKVE